MNNIEEALIFPGGTENGRYTQEYIATLIQKHLPTDVSDELFEKRRILIVTRPENSPATVILPSRVNGRSVIVLSRKALPTQSSSDDFRQYFILVLFHEMAHVFLCHGEGDIVEQTETAAWATALDWYNMTAASERVSADDLQSLKRKWECFWIHADACNGAWWETQWSQGAGRRTGLKLK